MPLFETLHLRSALEALKSGQIVAFIDDSSTDTVGYLAARADILQSETLSRLVNLGRGILFAAIPEERAAHLGLSLMGGRRNDHLDMTVSIEARHGVTTGISSDDRTATLRALANSLEPKRDLVSPGHIFPVRSKSGGTLVRLGIAEACTDVLTLAGLNPVAALTHILNRDGALLTGTELQTFLDEHKVPAITLSEVVHHRLKNEQLIDLIATTTLPTRSGGILRAHCFRARTDQAEHLALVKGELPDADAQTAGTSVLTRVQTDSPLSDLLGVGPRNGRSQIDQALHYLDSVESGVFVYIRHPARGLLREQVRSLATQAPTTPARMELREFGIGAQILRTLGVRRIRLLTNTKRSVLGLDAFDLDIDSYEPFPSGASPSIQ